MDGSYSFAHVEHSNSKMLVFLFMGENSITALLRTYVWGRQSALNEVDTYALLGILSLF
jgi:hypothetical protein